MHAPMHVYDYILCVYIMYTHIQCNVYYINRNVPLYFYAAFSLNEVTACPCGPRIKPIGVSRGCAQLQYAFIANIYCK